MVTGYCEPYRKCPECHEYGVSMAMTKKPMKIDGVDVWPLTLRCKVCAWELSEEEVIKSWRYMSEEVK